MDRLAIFNGYLPQAGEELRPGDLVQMGVVLRADERRVLSAFAVLAAEPTAEQGGEAALLEGPVPHWPDIEVDEARMRIPADAAPQHCPCRCDSVAELASQMYVKRTPVKMLTVLRDAEGGACQHRIGLRVAIGGQYGGTSFADSGHDVGQEIDDADIHLRLFARIMVAKEYAEFFHHPLDWTVVVAVGSVEGLPRMWVDEAEPAPGGGRGTARARAGTANPATRDRKRRRFISVPGILGSRADRKIRSYGRCELVYPVPLE